MAKKQKKPKKPMYDRVMNKALIMLALAALMVLWACYLTYLA